MNNTDVVRRYLSAINPADPDVETLRAVLADNVEIADPLMPITGAETFIAAITGAPEMSIGSTVQDVVADDRGVAAARVLVEVAGKRIQYAQWFWITEGRIDRVEVIYDPRPYLDMANG